MPKPTKSFEWKILRVGALRECLDAWEASPLYKLLNDSCRNAATLAIDEIGANFLRFSGPNATAMLLTITFDGREMVMTLDDDGAAFDPESAPEPPRGNLGLLPVGGRGLHMVRKLMDSWDYRHENKRNINVLKKTAEKKADA